MEGKLFGSLSRIHEVLKLKPSRNLSLGEEYLDDEEEPDDIEPVDSMVKLCQRKFLEVYNAAICVRPSGECTNRVCGPSHFTWLHLTTTQCNNIRCPFLHCLDVRQFMDHAISCQDNHCAWCDFSSIIAYKEKRKRREEKKRRNLERERQEIELREILESL